VKNFSAGLAPVEQYLKTAPQGKKWSWGYISKTGSYVIKPRFASAQPFSGGLARVTFHCETDEASANYVYYQCKWGYIDKTGKFAWMLNTH